MKKDRLKFINKTFHRIHKTVKLLKAVLLIILRRAGWLTDGFWCLEKLWGRGLELKSCMRVFVVIKVL